ncbi:MAG TPA: sodium-dependent transporter, partial [Beutenbergiaceae bacterium]|nr:sodium-dependent transporter [Beutenbergiaceae bacterium]
IISTMPGGEVLGVLFFASLVLAGITSLVSIVEVVLDAFEDKFNMSRSTSVGIIGGLMAIVSIGLFSTTEGLNLLDLVDNFANNFGIAGAGLISVITFGWALRKFGELRDHLNSVSSFKVGLTWQLLLSVVTPIILGFMFISEIIERVQDGYGDMPQNYVNTYGWGVAIGTIVIAIALSLLPWPQGVVETKGLNETERKELV